MCCPGLLPPEPNCWSSWPQKRKELALSDGHVLLLEYFEEHPPLLARPGASILWNQTLERDNNV
jgi:hypothetical protein